MILKSELESGLVSEGPLLEDRFPAILLPGYDWRPAHWAIRRRARRLRTPARLLSNKPTGILIHSGSLGEGTAQWAWRDSARFWAHFAFDSKSMRYVQTDSLDAWAPHGGPLNQYSWGIETPHHPGQDGRHRHQTIELVTRLVALGAQWLTGHRFINRTKRDPGQIVTGAWWDGLGIRVYWGYQGEGGSNLLAAEGLS